MPDSTFASFSLDRRPFVFAFSLVAFSDYHIVSSRCFLSSNFFGLAVIRFREFNGQSGDREVKAIVLRDDHPFLFPFIFRDDVASYAIRNGCGAS